MAEQISMITIDEAYQRIKLALENEDIRPDTEDEVNMLRRYYPFGDLKEIPSGAALGRVCRDLELEKEVYKVFEADKYFNTITVQAKRVLFHMAVEKAFEKINIEGRGDGDGIPMAETRRMIDRCLVEITTDELLQAILSKTEVDKTTNQPKRAKPTAAKTKRKPGKKQPKPPESLEEVKAYCKARNNNIDPQRFWDYYTAAEPSWHDKDGKPVLSWKQRIISWERSGGPPSSDTGIVGRGSNAQPAGRVPSGTDFLANN